MGTLAQKFRDLWGSLHAHFDTQAVEHVIDELLTIEGRVAELERLVRELVPGASGLPQLPDLTPQTHDPVSGLPLSDPASARTPGA